MLLCYYVGNVVDKATTVLSLFFSFSTLGCGVAVTTGVCQAPSLDTRWPEY
jgi:hypothetical protein